MALMLAAPRTAMVAMFGAAEVAVPTLWVAQELVVALRHDAVVAPSLPLRVSEVQSGASSSHVS